jgi:hypothetical protein
MECDGSARFVYFCVWAPSFFIVPHFAGITARARLLPASEPLSKEFGQDYRIYWMGESFSILSIL